MPLRVRGAVFREIDVVKVEAPECSNIRHNFKTNKNQER